MSDVIDIDDHRPHAVIWLVCLDCHDDWFGIAQAPYPTLYCKCGSDNLKGIQCPDAGKVVMYSKGEENDKIH